MKDLSWERSIHYIISKKSFIEIQCLIEEIRNGKIESLRIVSTIKNIILKYFPETLLFLHNVPTNDCGKCKNNFPCDKCGKVIPVDVFSKDFKRCEFYCYNDTGSHLCEKCFLLDLLKD